MSVFKRHLPPANDIHSLHVAIGRIWDAIEAGAGAVNAPATARNLGGASVSFSSGTPSASLSVHNALSGLQGGDTDNYWHLTSAEYTGTGTGVFVRAGSPALGGSPTAPTQLKADDSTKLATTAWVKLQNYQPQPTNDLSGEMTGFTDPENAVVTYDSAARTITLTGPIEAYYQGVVVDALVPGWVSPPHDATVGPWFLFYDGASFVWQNTSWTFDQLMIAFVNYGASDKFAIRETHGLMDWRSHEEFHRTIGTYLEAGGDIGGYTLASMTVAFRRPSVSPASIHDEDIHTTLPALADDGPYTQLYLTSTGTSTFAVAAAEIVPVLANNPYYNLFSTPNWTQTLMSNNSYMTVWLVAVPAAADAESQGYRFLWMQGQTNGSLASQQAYQFSSMNLGQLATLFTEFVAIGKVIIRYQGGNWGLTSVEKITGTRLSNVTAPAGNFLSSVTVTAPLTGTGIPSDPIVAPVATNTVPGLVPVPSPAGGVAKYLREDMTWVVPSGGGGGSATWTEVEVDFGSTPVYSATFTVVDAAVSAASKIAVVPCGKIATGGSEDDWEWDGITFAANPGAGSFRVMASAFPGPVAGKRKISYQVA